ncbi:ABC transporter substrate-binding protein [Devosia chinhatensis]|uniref:SsuA/THI5-like domain-containing protein n=1 Tax=Devosia chinhatensis TaxID=429727 RepID=A0A0F5FNF4_9HYPH|nr:ABC transporter substrate-binding protein [Devosia chinhatensis]KKB10075.1 hypothetical protein VE26_09860 [Devosia chinhatensis]
MRISLVSTALLASLLATSSTLAADVVRFQFSWLPGGDRAAYYLAQQQGLFAAEDLDVTLIAGRGSSDAITKIATGAADLGEGGLDALLSAKVEAEVPVIAVMPVYTRAPDGLLTTADSGIAGIEDVAGKTVGTSPFTSSNGPWPFLLSDNGVDPAQVNTTQADANALPAMLTTGQVDAIIQYVTNAPGTAAILEEAGKEQVVIPWADYGLDGYSASIFANAQFLADNRDVVIRFTRALRKAEEMLRADPAAGAAAVKDAIPEIDLDVTLAMANATLPLVFNESTEAAGLGVFDPARVTTTWEWVAKQKDVAPDTLDPMAAVDFDIARGE